MLTEKHPLDVQILTSYSSVHDKYKDIFQKNVSFTALIVSKKQICTCTQNDNAKFVPGTCKISAVQPISNQSEKNNKMSM